MTVRIGFASIFFSNEALMFTAWGILVPLAVLSAVNKNNLSFLQDVKVMGMPLWFATHRTFNYLAVTQFQIVRLFPKSGELFFGTLSKSQIASLL